MLRLSLSPTQKYKLSELLFIVAFWFIAIRSVIFFDFFGFSYGSTMNEPKAIQVLQENLFFGSFASILIGLFTGILELFFFQRYFRNRSFYKLFLSKIILYLISIFIISFTIVFSINGDIKKCGF